MTRKELIALAEVVFCLAAIAGMVLVIRWTVGTGLGQW